MIFLADGISWHEVLLFFFAGKKNQKPRRSLNSLLRSTYVLLPGLLSRLAVFYFLFPADALYPCVLTLPETNRPVGSDKKEQQDGAYSK